MPGRKRRVDIAFFALLSALLTAISPLPVAAQSGEGENTIRVIILKDFPPQFVPTPQGPSGLAVEVVQEVARRAALDVEFITVDSWQDVYAPLRDKTADVISNMGVSDGRQKIFEFTEPYEVFDIKLFVRTDTTDIEEFDDLNGRVLGVQKTNVLTKGLIHSGKLQIKTYPSFTEAFLGLLAGEVDAVPAPTLPFLRLAHAAQLADRIKAVGPSLLEVKRAMAVPKGQIVLRDRLNLALSEFKQTDDYQRLLTKWYGAPASFWTTSNIVILISALIATLLGLMGIWRYYDVARMNRRIRESEHRFDTSLKFANVGSWEWTIATGELHWSSKIFEMLGYNEGEIIPTYEIFMNAVHPDDRASVIEEINRSLESGGDYHVEHRVVLPDGTLRWVCENGNVVRDREQNPLKMLGVVQDITESRATAEELSNALADAERANQAKSEFLATMSHEFRTPLNAILGFSEMLRAQYLGPLGSEKYQEYAEDIHNSGAHLLLLINDMLDIATIEAGKRDLSKELVDLDDVLRRCLNDVEFAAEAAGLSVSLTVSDSLPDLYVDKRSLVQIVHNLLSNAIKFSETGGRIDVSASHSVNEMTLRI